MFRKSYIIYVLLIYSLLCTRFIVFSSKSGNNNYGEFALHVTRMDLCKGPKRKDCCDISARMENEVNLVYDINIKKDVIPTRGKVEAKIDGKPLLRLQMKKPCDHLFMKPLFQTILNVTQDCVFVKGNYHLNINIENIAQKYYGGMFLFGNLTFKSVFYNEECNFSCTVVQVELYPKKNKTSISIS